MLAIRLQRTGRKGHAQYKVVVQDSRFSPKSGKIVYYLGDYNPHTKQAKIDKEAGEKYLSNGAQPSDRAAAILKEAGVKLPKWYSPSPKQQKEIRNPDKLRKNRPEGEPAPVKAEVAENSDTAAEPVEAKEAEAEHPDEESQDKNQADSEQAAETSEQPAAIAQEPEKTDAEPAVEESAK